MTEHALHPRNPITCLNIRMACSCFYLDATNPADRALQTGHNSMLLDAAASTFQQAFLELRLETVSRPSLAP